MPELLALSAAVVFGLVHFFSGLLARRADSYGIATVGQAGGTVLVLAVAITATAVGAAAPVLAAPQVTAGAMWAGERGPGWAPGSGSPTCIEGWPPVR
jgi:hypothetical protein